MKSLISRRSSTPEILLDRFRDFGIIAVTGEPNHTLFAAKPSHLTLRILKRRLESQVSRPFEIALTREVLCHLTIADALEDRRIGAELSHQTPYFVDQSPIEHLVDPSFDPTS